MQHRILGKTGVRVSALGFGAMRLPTLGKESDVDEAAAVEMIRYAIDHGVNYIDTAYVYHGGSGEAVVGKSLADGYRQRVYLATKLPIWSVQTCADCDRILDEQFDRLQTDYLDFYLLHCLNGASWRRMREIGVPGWAEKAQARGHIRHFGFSFHGSYTVFKGNSVVLCRNLYYFLPESERAIACSDCGACEEKCPQQIPISQMMEKVRQQFA